MKIADRCQASQRTRHGRAALALAAGLALALAGCAAARVAPTEAVVPAAAPGPATKVLMIMEENHEYGDIIGDPEARYLNQLAGQYGSARHVDAGYPRACPSLAAYILLTSGSTQGICDDKAPKHHPLTADNLFHQVSTSGREWRDYAESAPGNCVLANASQGRYLVRHVPATYYVQERADCARWAVPLGKPASGALHADVTAGTLPAFGLVSPDACHDMHGAAPCPASRTANGDRWLRDWIPQILAGPDYQAGHLVVIITWDEGSGTDNHIPTLVIAPGTSHVTADQLYTHCSTLRTVEDLLSLPALGCARTTRSMTSAFRL
ncbi:alkaline phosphatase family protein [Krasilnikovia sp. MM14-A1259]|uniref:alkaline phosphatase family protein n=1 Tax=Krasilnikovia sp. MM14-A1259 TaxID=3373539 RepID=UPI00399CE5F9